MKWIGSIFSFLLIWLICSADGCNDSATMAERREESQISAMKDSVRTVFEAETPGINLLKAYEEAAKQKLIDFADYLKIASDSSVNNVFRSQAAEMAGKLFISGISDLSCWEMHPSASGRITLDSLLGSSLSNRMDSFIQPVQITVHKPLTPVNDSLYEGNLAFYPQRTCFIKPSSSVTGNEMFIINFYVSRKLKSFGKENLTIWQVGLGDMKIAAKQ